MATKKNTKKSANAIAVINAFTRKENTMNTKKNNTKAIAKIAEINGNLRRVSATTAGRTGWGAEFEIDGMRRMSDITAELRKEIYDNGYRWMKADIDPDNNYELVREGFFYKSFPTKKERDAEVKNLSSHLVNAASPAKKSAASPKKAEPSPKKTAAKKSAAKKAEPSGFEALLASISTMSAEEKTAIIAAMFGA